MKDGHIGPAVYKYLKSTEDKPNHEKIWPEFIRPSEYLKEMALGGSDMSSQAAIRTIFSCGSTVRHIQNVM
jgi:hypothetical protein